MMSGRPLFSPALRLALGVVSLLLSLMLLVDMAIGVIPDRQKSAVELRQHIAETLAVQITALLHSDQQTLISSTLDKVLRRSDELDSVAVRRDDGLIVSRAGDHARHWHLSADAPSNLRNVRVPLLAGQHEWGNVELSFRPAFPESVVGWLDDPLVKGIVAFACGGSLLAYLYLRRALQYLDPGSVIPQRVRAAFDTLGEAVMVLDNEDRVLLVNRAFAKIHPQASVDPTGKPVAALKWLMSGMGDDGEAYPWREVARTHEPVREQPVELLAGEAGQLTRILLSAAPILDGGNRVRGCIVSMADVTALHMINSQLLDTVHELDQSNELIRVQNEELVRLATRDPLTGCLNRRAFFERVSELVEAAARDGAHLSCIMSDVDFFKRFNDDYGHAIGDQVLQAVAAALGRGVRTDEDLVCRYGGEEFCIILPGLSAARAAEVAERLRASIERDAASGIRSHPGLRITSSFGVAELRADVADENQLIALADAALYEAKRAGRNRVQCAGQDSGVAA
ncbi:MAG: sensor domain-containing diguanylate cyclase [Rhodocyclaceae bacterium]|nr:sensor domain-containing diguanylate cyclase [Rhodocyclaceae bacterium]